MSLVYTTLATDTFHRANENPLANPPWSPDPSPPANNPCQIIGNECVGTIADGGNSDNEAKYTGISWPINQWAQMQVDSLATAKCSALLILRRQNSANGYVFELDGPPGSNTANIELFSLIGGVVTTIVFSVPITFVPGAVMRVEAFGSQLSAFYNGVLLGSGTDTNITTPGVVALDLFEDLTVSDTQVSNFSAGTMAPPSAGPTQFEQHYTLTSMQKDKLLVNVSNTVTSSVVNTVDDITQQLPGAANQTAPGSSAVPPPAPPLLKNMPPYFVMKNPA